MWKIKKNKLLNLLFSVGLVISTYNKKINNERFYRKLEIVENVPENEVVVDESEIKFRPNIIIILHLPQLLLN